MGATFLGPDEPRGELARSGWEISEFPGASPCLWGLETRLGLASCVCAGVMGAHWGYRSCLVRWHCVLCGSVGQESACSAGDPSSIPGSGRSAGEGIGYPLQHSCAFLVDQLLNNLPAMGETWVRSLGWEASPGDGKGYPLQYSGLENPILSMGSHRVGHD